jgi:hypothetical protein
MRLAEEGGLKGIKSGRWGGARGRGRAVPMARTGRLGRKVSLWYPVVQERSGSSGKRWERVVERDVAKGRRELQSRREGCVNSTVCTHTVSFRPEMFLPSQWLLFPPSEGEGK